MDKRWQGLIYCEVTAASSSRKGKIDRFDESGKQVWIDFGPGVGLWRYNPYSVFVRVKGIDYRLEHLMDILEMFSYGPPEATEGEV